VEQGALISKLNKMIPGAVLEAGPFGRSKTLAVWVETRFLLQICQAVRADEELSLDILENLSVMELDQALVATYFLRSMRTGQCLIIRSSAAMPDPLSWVDMPSVRRVWPMARPFEREIAELFGIQFKTEGTGESRAVFRILPEGWAGFPLRKKYVFPSVVQGITHSRLPTKRYDA